VAQWIALAVTIVSAIIVGAGLWGRMSQRMDDAEFRIKSLEDDSQTPGEREAVKKIFETRFAAHESLDDIRFANLQQAIHAKLDAILLALNHQNGR